MIIKGKTAVVTGASKGIGRAIALALAGEGANVAVSARSRDLLERVAGDIEERGVRAYAHAGDMSAEEDIRKLVAETAARFGGIHILVNNAGVGYFDGIADLSTEAWDEMFDLNVRGLFIATRESLPHLRRAKESVVVNIASLAGKNFFKGGGGYAASKHAVMGLSRCLMLEERDHGVRVLVICPGSVQTGFFESQEVSAERLEHMLRPEDVAESVVAMIKLPQRAMVSEIDIRPTNPKS